MGKSNATWTSTLVLPPLLVAHLSDAQGAPPLRRAKSSKQKQVRALANTCPMDSLPALVCQKILKHVPAYDWFFVARVNKWWLHVTRALLMSDGKHALFSPPATSFTIVCDELPTLWYALAPLRENCATQGWPLLPLRMLWFGPPPLMTHYELQSVETLCKALWSLDMSRSTLAEFVPHLLHWRGDLDGTEFSITQTEPMAAVFTFTHNVAYALEAEPDCLTNSFTPTDWNGRFLRLAMTANVSLDLIRYTVLELMGASNMSVLSWARLMYCTLYVCRLDVAMWLDAEASANNDINVALCQVAKRVVRHGTSRHPSTQQHIYAFAGENALEQHRAIRSLLCRRRGLLQLVQRDTETLLQWTCHCIDLDIAPSPAHLTCVQPYLSKTFYQDVLSPSRIFAYMVDRACARPLVDESLPWLSLLVQTHPANRSICAQFVARMYQIYAHPRRIGMACWAIFLLLTRRTFVSLLATGLATRKRAPSRACWKCSSNMNHSPPFLTESGCVTCVERWAT
jgi:hypothetical protein